MELSSFATVMESKLTENVEQEGHETTHTITEAPDQSELLATITIMNFAIGLKSLTTEHDQSRGPHD